MPVQTLHPMFLLFLILPLLPPTPEPSSDLVRYRQIQDRLQVIYSTHLYETPECVKLKAEAATLNP